MTYQRRVSEIFLKSRKSLTKLLYDKWTNDSRHKISLKLICREYCEIDNFTGNEMLRISCNIVSEKIDDGSYAYKPGNVLYFLKNRNAYAAIMFTKSTPLIITLPLIRFENDGDVKYKRLYTKLFDDGTAEYYRRMSNPYSTMLPRQKRKRTSERSRR